MREMPKILFTDLDDTLLDSRKQVTPENRRAICEAGERGHQIVICTGRPLMGATALIRGLGLARPGSYAVTYNGGVIYDCYKKQVIYQKSIPIPHVKYLFQKSRQYNLFCQTYSDTHLLAPCPSPELDEYLAKSQMPCQIQPSLPDCLVKEPAKVLVIGSEDQKQLNRYLEDIREWAEDKISLFYSSRIYLEHVPLGISKGSAVYWLCRHLHIPLENTVAVGDQQNDIPMLQAAHVGAAMANATAECRAAADFITEKDCDHSGFAEVIYRFLLND